MVEQKSWWQRLQGSQATDNAREALERQRARDAELDAQLANLEQRQRTMGGATLEKD